MKYSQEITEKIATFIEQGMSQKDSALLADIDEKTFYNWRRKYSSFSSTIKKAELKCKQRNVNIIQMAAIKTWQAAAWWLERKYPARFASRSKMDISSKGKSIAPLDSTKIAKDIHSLIYGNKDNKKSHREPKGAKGARSKPKHSVHKNIPTTLP